MEVNSMKEQSNREMPAMKIATESNVLCMSGSSMLNAMKDKRSYDVAATQNKVMVGFVDSGLTGSGIVEKYCCNESWVRFTETTSLHGLRYIWLRDTFTIRRLFWLVLVMVCVGLMSFQIIDRIVYYYAWPVTVNMQVNYNKTLTFPTVTICNQNVFRATAAAYHGHYQLLSDMFSDVKRFSSSDIQKYAASNVTMESLMRSTAHTKEDLIVKCQWSGEACSADDFTDVLTDHGMCYMFNGQTTTTPQRVAHEPGTENGLSLTLNVEQYEYMPGPHDAAGVKVLIHDGKQFPKVHELGIALPTGAHSFVGIKLISVDNLPSPHGKCKSPTLKYYNDYSLENCEVECVTDLLAQRCGCRRYYMPHVRDHPPVCSLHDIYTCYNSNIGDIRRLVQELCGCAIPCHFHIFDPTVSYATTSMLVVDRFLAETNRTDLRQKYHIARDVIGRLQKDKFQEMKGLTDSVQRHYTKLEKLILQEIPSKLEEQEFAMNSIYNETVEMGRTVLNLFRYQRYIVQKNFVRARDAMIERTFSVLGNGIQEFAFSIETQINQLLDGNYTGNVREAIYLMTRNRIDARIDIAERTFENYTQLYNAFVNGQSIFNYRYHRFSRKLSPYIVPTQLLSDAMNRSKSIKFRSERLGRDIANITMMLKAYRTLVERAYINRSNDHGAMLFINTQFLYFSRQYLQSKSMFFYDMMDWPVKQMELRERLFSQQQSELGFVHATFTSYIHSISNLLNKTEQVVLNEILQSLQLSVDYLQFKNVNKMNVANSFHTQYIGDEILNMAAFFNTVRNRGQGLYDEWNRMRVIVLKMWKFVTSDINIKRFLRHQNYTTLLRRYEDIEADISTRIDQFRDSLDLRFVVHNVDADFFTAYDHLRKYMEEFIDSSHIDSQFIRNNFLRVDIFYRELNYEQITQQKAYDVFGLLCDIGGSMGLFVGASVMTMFEIIDLIAYHTTLKVLHRIES